MNLFRVSLPGNPVGMAREILLRKEGHSSAPDPGRDYGIDMDGEFSTAAGVPTGGASEVIRSRRTTSSPQLPSRFQ